MFEKDRPWPDLADEALRDFEPGDQSPLPRPQASRSASARPFSRRDRSAARYRADSGRNCACPSPTISRCSPAIRGARASRSRWSRRSRVPSASRPLDDRLDRREIPLPIGDEERVAPDTALGRNEQAERRKPILIDEMLERHRRRMDVVIEIVHALRVRRIDAERMQSGPVLRRSGTTSHCESGRRQASLIGDDRQIRRLVEERRERPALDTGSASRSRRRKFRNGVRTASRQAVCSDRLMRTSFSFSIRSRATMLRWVSNKSRSAPQREG